MRLAVLIVALGLLACSGDTSCAERSHETPPPVDTETSTVPSEQQGAAAPLDFARPDAGSLAELQTRVRAHRSTAAEALAAGEAIRALTELQAAAVLDPMSVTLLSELGTAQLHVEHYDEAVRTWGFAIHHTDDLQARAAFVDKLAIAHAPGSPQLAAELFARSLELRPDAAISERLAQLTGGVEVISHARCGWTMHELTDDKCAAYLRTLAPGPERSCTKQQLHADVALPDGRTLSLFAYAEPALELETYVIAMSFADRWWAAPLAWVRHPTAAYADETIARIDVRLEDLAPGVVPEFVIEWDIVGRALLLDDGVEQQWRVTNLAVLLLATHEPRWLLALRTHAQRSSTPLSGGETTEQARDVAVAWNEQAGTFTVNRTDHEPTARLGEFGLGSYPLLCPAELDAG